MRLFVALMPPEAVRQALWARTATLRESGLPARWIPPHSLHVTLRFLGEVPTEREAEVAAAVEGAVRGTPPFQVSFTEFGAFPHVGRPRVIWVGLEPLPALELLQDGVERAVNAIGFEPEGKVFRPHLTIGRARRDARPGAWHHLSETLPLLSFQSAFVVDRVDVMESRLRTRGAEYRVRCPVPLGVATPG